MKSILVLTLCVEVLFLLAISATFFLFAAWFETIRLAHFIAGLQAARSRKLGFEFLQRVSSYLRARRPVHLRCSVDGSFLSYVEAVALVDLAMIRVLKG